MENMYTGVCLQAVLPWKYPCISTFLSDFFYRDVYEKKFGIGKKKAQKQKKVKKSAPIGDVSSELILEFKNLTLLRFILFLFLCNFDSKDNID